MTIHVIPGTQPGPALARATGRTMSAFIDRDKFVHGNSRTYGMHWYVAPDTEPHFPELTTAANADVAELVAALRDWYDAAGANMIRSQIDALRAKLTEVTS